MSIVVSDSVAHPQRERRKSSAWNSYSSVNIIPNRPLFTHEPSMEDNISCINVEVSIHDKSESYLPRGDEMDCLHVNNLRSSKACSRANTGMFYKLNVSY